MVENLLSVIPKTFVLFGHQGTGAGREGAGDESREGYFPVVLLFIRCTGKVVLTFESVGEILKCVHSVECQ